MKPRFCTACGGTLEAAPQAGDDHGALRCSGCGRFAWNNPEVHIRCLTHAGGRVHGCVPATALREREKIQAAGVRVLRETCGIELGEAQLRLLATLVDHDADRVYIVFTAATEHADDGARPAADEGWEETLRQALQQDLDEGRHRVRTGAVTGGRLSLQLVAS